MLLGIRNKKMMKDFNLEGEFSLLPCIQQAHDPGDSGHSGSFGKRHGVNVAVANQIALQSLSDTLMTSQEQCGDMICSSCVRIPFVWCPSVGWNSFHP